MEWKRIQSELQRLASLVEGWVAADRIPDIERDLVLDRLRALYGELLFVQTVSVEERGKEPEEAGFTLAHGIDLEEAMAAEPHYGGESKPGPMSETTAENISAAMPAPLPEPSADADAFLPEEETEPEISVAEALHVAATQQVGAERGVSGSQLPSAETTAPGESNEAARGCPEDAVNPVPEVSPSETVPQGGHEPTLNSLFDLDDLVDRRRKNRRVILSLYESEEEDTRAGFRQEKPNPEKHVAPEPCRTATPGRSEFRAADAEALSAARMPEEPQKSNVAAMVDVYPDHTDDNEIVMQPTAAVAPPEHGEPEPSAGVPEPVAPSVGITAPSDSRSEALPSASDAAPGGEGARLAPPEAHVGCGESGERRILGEVMGQGVQTLADRIIPPQDLAATLAQGEPVDELRKAIGVNDRFLMIRDLFAGDAAAYERAIDRLDAFDDLDDCLIHIAEHYAWNPNSDGARLLTDLLERKLG